MSISAEHILEVRAGAAEPASMQLVPGQELGPLSLGTGGGWRLSGPGLLAEHGYLYFNGSALFFQSAHVHAPVVIGGRSIPTEWTEVEAPCEVALGGVRIAVRPAAMPSRPPLPSRRPPPLGGRPEKPGGLFRDEDSDATRLQPIEELAAERLKNPRPLAGGGARPDAFGAPQAAPADAPAHPPATAYPGAPGMLAVAPSFGGALAPYGPAEPAGAALGPHSGAMGGLQLSDEPTGKPPSPQNFANFQPLAPGAAPPAGSAGKSGGKKSLREEWRETPPIRKAMVGLMALSFAAIWVIFTDAPEPEAEEPEMTAPTASASASASAIAAATATATPTQPSAAHETPPDGPPERAEPVTAAKDAPAATAQPATATEPPLPPGKKTAQREAADAVAAGAYERAAKLYGELAQQHPDVSAYAEAERIMRNKAGIR